MKLHAKDDDNEYLHTADIKKATGMKMRKKEKSLWAL